MEDLIPFLIFVAIGGINLLSFLAKKSKQSRQAEGSPEPQRPPSQLERFFEQLSEQLNPQEPTELPDWPEGLERPDYIHEMEAVEEVEEPQPNIMPDPQVQTKKTPTPSKKQKAPFRIGGKKELRQAMLAHIIFSPPRAIDFSFDDTLSK